MVNWLIKNWILWADKLVTAGLNKDLNFKDEMVSYQDYRPIILHEQQYLQFLVEPDQSVNELALYSWCAELLLSDNILTSEEELLKHIGDALGIDDNEQSVAKKIMIQRKVVETEKIF